MSTIVNDIYFKSLALYDEISKTGTIDASKTLDYKVRTPSMVDMFQKELILDSDTEKIFEYAYVPSTTETWTKITLPSDYYYLSEVMINNTPETLSNLDYSIENDGSIFYMYIKRMGECTLRIKYKYVPATITALEDALQIDDFRAQLIAYQLCRWFAISEQNPSVASACEAKFEQLKRSIRQPARAERIKDIYSSIR